jgi:hypothetical protein
VRSRDEGRARKLAEEATGGGVYISIISATFDKSGRESEYRLYTYKTSLGEWSV